MLRLDQSTSTGDIRNLLVVICHPRRNSLTGVLADAIAMFFPVWWWSAPAMLKGWIDRAWNYGWAYGWAGTNARIPLDKALMVALGGSSREDFASGGYDKLLDTQLRLGLMTYCGIDDVKLEIITDTLNESACST